MTLLKCLYRKQFRRWLGCHKLGLLLLSFASLSLGSGPMLFAQGGGVDGQVVQPAIPTGNGGPAAFATIRVCPAGSGGTPCPATVSLFSDPGLTQPISNPTTADVNGNYSFFASPNYYIMQILPIPTNSSIVYTYVISAEAGSVTSFTLLMPNIFTLNAGAGCTVTTSLTCNVTLVSQSANTIFAAPNGVAGFPSFRQIAPADFPAQAANTVLGNCTGGSAVPTFCLLTANMIPSALNATTFNGNVSVIGSFSATGTGAFSGQLSDALLTNQIVFGSGPNFTTLNFPAPAGAITLTFPNTADTMVGRATTDTLTNKTLTAPIITNPVINTVGVLNSPGTYINVLNNATGTVVNELAKLTAAPSTATVSAITDTAGIVGICISGCGNSGTALIQSSGTTLCTFDNATVAGDYVVISSTTPGDCHDNGAAYPSLSQNLGRVLSTNGAAGTYGIILYGGDVKTATSGSAPSATIANAGVTGTTLNTLTKLTGNPSTAVISSSGDTGGAIGITTGGAGTLGSATVQLSGIASCVFDGATSANDYVQISGTVAGNCHDVLTTYPGTGQIIGRVLSTNASGGTYSILLFGAEIKGGGRFFSASGCSPATSTDSNCTGAVNISPAMADTSYIPQLTLNNNAVGNPFLSIVVNGSLTTTQIPYNITCTFSCGTIGTPTIYVHIDHQ